MKLPRFTSGDVGRLNFSHLNEAFDRIETEFARIACSDRAQEETSVIAQIMERQAIVIGTDPNTNNPVYANIYSWQEIERDEVGRFNVKANGLNSGGQDNPFDAPAIQLADVRDQSVKETLALGESVILVPRISSSGVRYWIITRIFPFKRVLLRINNATEIRSQDNPSQEIGLWRYSCSRVRIRLRESATPGLSEPYAEVVDDGGDYWMWNSCELLRDFPASNQWGVGFLPTRAPVRRKALRSGLVVEATYSADVMVVPGLGFGYVCSVPNGYQYS